MSNLIDKIAIKSGTDKSSLIHNYTRIYGNLFKDRNQIERILEIGIFEGASIDMWLEYFPNATIYGIDIRVLPQVRQKYANNDRVVLMQHSQTDPELVEKLVGDGGFDMIIDDGSHDCRDVGVTFNMLYALLKESGFYIIEDVHAWFDNGGIKNYHRAKDLIMGLFSMVNLFGLSGFGDIDNDEDQEKVYKTYQEIFGENYYESFKISEIRFYKSLILVKK